VLALAGEAAPPALRARVQVALGFLLHEYREERAPLESFLAALPVYREGGDSLELAELLNGLGWNAYSSGIGDAGAYFAESLAIARQSGNVWWTAANLHGQAAIATYTDFDRARALYEESLGHFRRVGDQNAVAFTMDGLGELALSVGDPARATALFEEALPLARVHGTPVSVNGLICGLAKAHMQLGRLDEAAALVEESLAIAHEIGNPNHVAFALGMLGKIAALAQEWDKAQELLEQGLAITRTREMPWDMVYMLDGLARVAWAQANRGASARYCLESLHFYRSREARYGMAQGIELVAEQALADGQHELATTLLAALHEMRIGRRASDIFRADDLVPPTLYDAAVATARGALDERAFAAAWDAGLALTLVDAATRAIAAADDWRDE
jgi:tetratricopeptide (TPR) repeat protein